MSTLPPGLTELDGPGTGLSCRHEAGIHYWADYYILEVLDPETLKPVGPGDQLVIDVRLTTTKRGIWKFSATAKVDGQVAAEADLMCAMRSTSA